jgi:hypothetical protein
MAAAVLSAVALSTVTGPGTRAQSEPVSPSCNIQTTERIVAVGDVHGAFDSFVAILREAKLIDDRRRWTGGRAILVQTGDVLDRGPDSKQAIDLLRSLERDAARAGGQVHALLGNHEVMRLSSDRRYVSAGEYDAFRTADSHDLQQRALEFLTAENAKRANAAGTPFDARQFETVFLKANPPGAVELQVAFGPNGEYGRWVRARDLMVKINGIVFLHGGLTPAVAALGCTAINARARAELKDQPPGPKVPDALTTGTSGPLWYRGLIDDRAAPGPVDAAAVDAVLKAIDARAIVVGHTASRDFLIRVGASGRVIQIDTGMLGGDGFPGGRPSALEIAGDTFTAIYPGKREPLPVAALP